ncbi:DUF6264 family protein [Spelaeicoccus albus]|uniref:Uncharacterized protein n=1 Tax=Spelaeicoccus albus TaxID=1280376 RepID=A0A7Z0D384_9MICO|nr:DUF6264 family protein [Spelaeicoccus albus]NYI68018.1 hypothetical protein [Spelaeicoccus albus]
MTPTNEANEANARPKYGLYATPEEQRASIKEPDKYFDEFQAAALGGGGVDASAAAAPTSMGSQTDARRTDAARTGSSQARNSQAHNAAAGKPAPTQSTHAADGFAHHPVDRVTTFILLAIGLFFSVAIVPGMLHPADAINASYQQFGLGSYEATGVTKVVGVGIAFFYIVGWLYAAFSSMARLRKGRYAWWIPAVTGVVVWILTMIGFAVLMLTDPSFMSYATSGK